jgi:hypothetical protein
MGAFLAFGIFFVRHLLTRARAKNGATSTK